MAEAQRLKGWFQTPGRKGDRTLDQQIMGLYPALNACSGKSVMDIGCAEGLVALEFARAGASEVQGFEIRKDHVEVGRRLIKAAQHEQFMPPVQLHVQDANVFAPAPRTFDVVLLLAILHKLRSPTAAAARFAEAARELVVLRLPPEHAPTIIDERSGNQPHYIGQVMERRGFLLDKTLSGKVGPFGEWMGYYRRVIE